MNYFWRRAFSIFLQVIILLAFIVLFLWLSKLMRFASLPPIEKRVNDINIFSFGLKYWGHSLVYVLTGIFLALAIIYKVIYDPVVSLTGLLTGIVLQFFILIAGFMFALNYHSAGYRGKLARMIGGSFGEALQFIFILGLFYLAARLVALLTILFVLDDD